MKHIEFLNQLIKEQESRKFKLIALKEYIIDLKKENENLTVLNAILNQENITFKEVIANLRKENKTLKKGE